MRLLTLLPAFILILSYVPAAASERWEAANRYAREGRSDFAFMEYQAFLREEPDHRRAREARFGTAEYHFLNRNVPEARRAFEKSLSTDKKDATLNLLALAHLAILEKEDGDAAAAARHSDRLVELLSSSKLLLVFDDKRTRRWLSPIGRRFQFNEYVDRMEILENGKAFYTIHIG